MAADSEFRQQLPQLIEEIVASYSQLSATQHLGHCPLPSPEIVIGIVDDLKEVLFPGYGGRQNLHPHNVRYRIGDLIDSLHGRLSGQIAGALRHENRMEHGDQCDRDKMQEFESQGEAVAFEFLRTIPHLRETLALDVQAAYDGDPAASSMDEIIFCYPGMEAITVYRAAHELHSLGVSLIPRMWTEWAHSRTGIDIHPGAHIGHSFFIDHGTGVVIGETCDIDVRVKLYQGVTLGALSFPKDENGNLLRKYKRHPTIEQGVVIYANATILGGETVVGANSVIGSSVSLHQSVPPNTVVTIERPSLRFREAS